MKGVTSEVIAEVRSRASILEVVSERVVLKRAGKEHKGLCPFHNEKTPSFTVNEEKRIFKCFGCGEAGDVFGFVQKVQGTDFIDAVRYLAQKYSVPLIETNEERQEYDRRTAMLMLYQQASEFYSHLLKDPVQGATARDYLEARGISATVAEQFKLGYAPATWDALLRYLTTNTKISAATLEQAGLVRHRPDSSSYYDLFRNRLVIPICDDQGRVIAFGGRTLGDDQVKYLNSPETPIYTKGQHLFALHLAKESIKESDSVIVVEGYFDAITPHQFGFANTVATLGTALTEQQARNLVRYTESKRVYLAFDSDAAGIKAVERGGQTLNQIAEGVGIELRVIRIPGGKDPDECLRSTDPNAGPDGFRHAIAGAPLLVEHQLEQAIGEGNVTSHTGRIDAAKRLVPVLAQIKNAVARGEYVRQWALRLGLREEELLSDVGQFRREHGLSPRSAAALGRQPQARDRPTAKTGQRLASNGYTAAEQQLLALYLTSREDYARTGAVLSNDQLITPAHQRIKEAIDGIGSQFNTVEDLQYKLMDRLGPDKEASSALVEVILRVEELRKQNAPIDTLLVDLRTRLLKERLDREVLKMRALLNSDSEVNQRALQGKIGQLKVLQSSSVSIKTVEEVELLKHKIEAITVG